MMNSRHAIELTLNRPNVYLAGTAALLIEDYETDILTGIRAQQNSHRAIIYTAIGCPFMENAFGILSKR